MPNRLTLATLGTFLAFALPAAAQQQCAPREAVVAHLNDNFSETRQAIGVARGNRVMEVFASDESGSWTITVTHPNGVTCLVAAGQGFELLVETLQPAGIQS